MTRFLALLSLLAPLAACAGVSPTPDREQARATVLPVVEQALRAEGPRAERAAECVLANAGAPELVKLASAAGQAATPETVRLVMVIAQRGPAIECLRAAAT